ncbi:MAG TPA: ATP-binding protein [Mucilaginibacter sp.]
MKKLFKITLCGFVVLSVTPIYAQHSIKKTWSTDSVLAIPESVLLAKEIMYVSLIDGDSWTKDGKGGVGKLTRSGKIINQTWITGLNAPKGMVIKGDFLYVADVDELVVISISKNKIDHKIKINGAAGLNDVTLDKTGSIYVTDTNKGNVYKVTNDKPELYLDNLKSANGIKAVGDKLYILDGDGMYVTGKDKKLTKICALEHGGDGIEPIGNGDFLVTEWAGYFYYVSANGNKQLLLDTHATNKRTADIGYDPIRKIIYMPTFSGKSVVAYTLD